MKAGGRNKRVIFIAYLIIAVIGYFTVPYLLKSDALPAEQRAFLTQHNVVGIANEVEFISDHEVLSYKTGASARPSKYLICSINDDPDGTNAYGIYDPTDLAVTVHNLLRLETKHLFLGTHLHWPDLPAAENNTLGSQLALLDSCILSAPLRRTALEGVLPEYLYASSVELASIMGGSETLPRVNNLSLAPTLEVPANCLVGFSQLESEPALSSIPLLAVWGDRVILSSLLLEHMHQLGVGLDEIEITTKKHIKLGETGNVIQIDEFGYFAPGEGGVAPVPDIISADITSFKESPVDTGLAILTASGVQADSYRAIVNPVQQLTQLKLTPYYEDLETYHRLPWWGELAVVVVVGVLLILLAGSSCFLFWFWALVLGAVVYMSSIHLNAETWYFMPILYVLTAIFFSMFVRLFLKKHVQPKQKSEIDAAKAEVEVSPKKFQTLAEKNKELAFEVEDDFEGDFCDIQDPVEKREKSKGDTPKGKSAK